ncbi:MAG: T9SS type A sorting domain-containing protein [Bacteroidetes bacterium]|nr:T9SS type A sorting domain-containing protein [Bacteroidota bacterium]
MKKSITLSVFLIAAGIACCISSFAQTTGNLDVQTIPDGAKYCGQVQYENYLRSKDPYFDMKKERMEKQIQAQLENFMQQRANGNPNTYTLYTIPTVVHVVYSTASQNLSDAAVTQGITRLNEDFRKQNSDIGQTPSVWQSITADLEVQFCLASKDPSGNPTTGIIHKSTTHGAFTTDDAIKSTAAGGDDPWNYNNYFNIWIGDLSGGLGGYGVFPPLSASYGAVADYCTITGLCAGYGLNRVMVHELSHCFALYHIWGDDGGACTGDDQISDTPNQADANFGCLSYPAMDACSPNADGQMFMNYMDYTSDNCKVMFTAGQKARVQWCVSNYLMSLVNYSATACTPAVAIDAGINSILTPTGTICSGTFSPVVKVNNFGATTLTSCTINYHYDSNPNQTQSWTGSLASGQSANVTLPSMTVPGGAHIFYSSTSNPNSSTDQNTSNDQSTSNFTVGTTASLPPIVEGFQSAFPPAGWSLYNPNSDVTWVANASIGNPAPSALFDNCTQNVPNTRDQLRTTVYDFSNATSAQMTFDVGYSPWDNTYSDTLAVDYSINCGSTWTQIYIKGGMTLASVPCAMSNTVTCGPYADAQGCFTPNGAGAWRNDNINLSVVVGQPSVMFAFENHAQYGSNLFIDNINITSVVGMADLSSASGFSMYPNPASSSITIQGTTHSEKIHYSICNIIGDEIIAGDISANGNSYTGNIQVSDISKGMYFIKVSDKNSSFTKKLNKQ